MQIHKLTETDGILLSVSPLSYSFPSLLINRGIVLFATTGCALQLSWEIYNICVNTTDVEKGVVAGFVFILGLSVAVMNFLRERGH